MDALGKFTQYYVVSMILPGLFNAAIIIFSINGLNVFPVKIQPTTFDWLFIVFFSTIATLFIGIISEKKIFSIMRDKKFNRDTITSYSELDAWRIRLFSQIDENQKLRSAQLISYTEQLMAEYYFLNNIIPGLIIASLLFLVYLPYTSSLSGISSRIGVIVLTAAVLLSIRKVMRIWLRELFKLQATKF